MFHYLFYKGKKRLQTGLSPATLLKIRNVLSKGLGQAVKNGFISKNPVDGSVLPSINSPTIKIFSTYELKKLSSAIKDDRIGILIKVLLRLSLKTSNPL